MTAASPPSRSRSRATATWLALVGGSLGAHRFYLHGARDVAAWLHPWPTLIGAYGFWRMRELGVDDRLGALLVPLLGVMVAIGMLCAIRLGLTSEERWSARFGPARARAAWPTIAAVIVALALGATVTMATIAFTAQRYFELRT